ncbi:MAG TPA: isoprenylcysteine carboxylmethyltransferase family protein [Anaerolineales bacterium]|nr:isoprenylcysteine carboxylmethyltransferase family protein [Anaerolineales bacterium]
MVGTRLAFLVFVAGLALQRLLELRLSKRNEQWMRRQGGVEHAAETYPWIVALHAAWFASMLVEVFTGRRRFRPRLATLAFGVFAVGQALRLTAIRTLGWRWSTRIMTVPRPAGERVRHGMYRYIRHPNYLGVQMEIMAAPLVHSAYLTSAAFGVANLLLLHDRTRREEQALSEEYPFSGDDYEHE